ncbi:hypothetical protein IW261DRAFT_1443850 [Armillaria novae-zelandiae]|uniref:Uncharacterized protein n=1 Tax=Armillaria novae-zelandiae TaxID=153914 RepID=A0AA39PS97_9AGAR|nr:hypothetical protein IW261DRAFT_1443850 [Armillaria novae-zelandiae]
MYSNILFLLCSVSLVVAVPRDWSTFANDPMGSMNCKPTAQGDATQQAMIDCRKGLTGDQRDISAYVIDSPIHSRCNMLNLSSVECTSKEHALQRMITINIIKRRTTKPRSHVELAKTPILTTMMLNLLMILLTPEIPGSHSASDYS